MVIGQGSLYTSILPNLLIKSLPEALRASRALNCTSATSPRSTVKPTATRCTIMSPRLKTLMGSSIIDVVLSNARTTVKWVEPPVGVGEIVRTLTLDGSPRIMAADVIDEARPWRHDSVKLAQAVMQTYHEMIWGE